MTPPIASTNSAVYSETYRGALARVLVYHPKDASTSLFPPNSAVEAWPPRRRTCCVTSWRTFSRKPGMCVG
jgi:hypothetical protein